MKSGSGGTGLLEPLPSGAWPRCNSGARRLRTPSEINEGCKRQNALPACLIIQEVKCRCRTHSIGEDLWRGTERLLQIDEPGPSASYRRCVLFCSSGKKNVAPIF